MNESILKKFENFKSAQFKRNNSLDNLIKELKSLLAPIQKDINDRFIEPKWPVGFIIGNTRSGTSILTQWLASLDKFSYPSNFLTRFAYAPYIGSLIQKMIFDKEFDFHEDFFDIQSGVNFKSDLGKSKGALAVNEFQHFFRNYMNFTDPSYIEPEDLKHIDFKGIKRGLASIEKVFNKPFITKMAMLKYNIDRVYYELNNSFFFYIERDPMLTMQSIFYARQRFYGETNIWYGSKPKEYKHLKEMDVYHQIAGQVYFTDKSIQENLSNINSKHYLTIKYEDFCHNPENIYHEIRQKYITLGYDIKSNYGGPKEFNISNKLKLKNSQKINFERAYNYFVKQCQAF